MVWKAAFAVVLAALFGQTGAALAAANSDPLSVIAEADWIASRQVLVIPQQCSREAVSTLCDRSDDGAADFAARRGGRDGAASRRSASRTRSGFVYGTVTDYERQRTAGEPAPVAPGYVTIPPAIPVQPRDEADGTRSRHPAPAALAPTRNP